MASLLLLLGFAGAFLVLCCYLRRFASPFCLIMTNGDLKLLARDCTELKDDAAAISPKAAFECTRLNPSTFLIVEHSDVWNEEPFIYVKLFTSVNTIVVIDTGCGGATFDSSILIRSLCHYIENVPVEANGGCVLNPLGYKEYVIVQTHCHYDHILGASSFAPKTPILASAHDPSFLSPENLPATSLCADLGIHTVYPAFTLVPHNHNPIAHLHPSPTVKILHTPGHTPDSLSVWDAGERMLFVGDTLYERSPIIFPAYGGSLVDWFASVGMLVDLVQENSPFLAGHNGDGPRCLTERVKISCGHSTAGADALDVLIGARAFMEAVRSVWRTGDVNDERAPGKDPDDVLFKGRYLKRGVWTCEWWRRDGRFGVVCPEELLVAADNVLLTSTPERILL